MAHIDARHALQRERQVASTVAAGQAIADVSNSPEGNQRALSFTRQEIARFSQQQELEADTIGIRIMSNAGYTPQGSVGFLNALERYTDLQSRALNRRMSPEDRVMATHPATPERIAAAKRNVREVQGRAGSITNHDEYLRALNGMLYGDDPGEGFVRGQTYLHPRLGITFSLPDSFGMMNTPSAVVGFADNGSIIRFDGIDIPTRVALTRYLERNAVRGGRVVSVEETTVAGRPAAIAVVTNDQWAFRMALIRAQGSAVYRFILAAKQLQTEDEAPFRQAVDSFLFITPQEALAARPQRLVTRTVRPGETPASIARDMAVPTRKLETFLTLNALRAGQTLRPGELVKTIAE